MDAAGRERLKTLSENKQVSGSVALKAGVWYVISSVMVKAISVITTPIFTRLMTTAEYGTVSTFTSWHTLLLTFFTLNLTYSIGRAKLDYPDDLDNYVGSMQLLSAVVSGAICAVVLLFLEPFSNLLELSEFAVVLLLIYLFFGPAISFRQNSYRYRYKYKQNIAIAWYTALVSVALSLVLMLASDQDRDIRRMIGLTLPTAALGLVFWIQSLRKKQVHFNKEYWKYGWKLSGPMILHAVSLNILAQSDRVFIAKIGTSEDVGIYSLVYSYGILLQVITNAVSDGWLPWFHDNYYAKNFSAIRENSKKIVLLGCFLSLACISLAPEAIWILGGENYLSGVYCLPPIVLGVLCQYVYTHYVNIELHLKKTKYVSMGTISAAALNIILNAIFIPKFGYTAAAYTTMFSYLCLLFVHYFITRKVLKVNLYQNIFMFASVLVTGGISVVLVLTYNYTLVRYALIAIGFVIFLWVFRDFIKGYLQKLKNKKKKAGE